MKDDENKCIIKGIIVKTIQWKESYSVGNETIDFQHKKLIGMINRMILNEGTNVDSEIISDVLSGMIGYAGSHFNAEEAYMEQIGYPELEMHKEEHKKFKLKASYFCFSTMKNETLVPEEILQFLSKWLINHILHTDMKYKKFCESENHEVMVANDF